MTTASHVSMPVAKAVEDFVKRFLTARGLGDEVSFIERSLLEILDERNRRADEMDSLEIEQAVAIVSRLFPVIVYGILCMDGRVGPAVKFGFPGKYGGFLRTPGGDVVFFVPRSQGLGSKSELFLPRHTQFAAQLDGILGKHGTIVQLLDSHISCAAQGAKEARKGRQSKDGGLGNDVLRKRNIAQAMMTYAAMHHSGKHIIPIQFSYNPHDGYGFMGLETVLESPEVQNVGGFTGEALEQLVQNGRILSTRALSESSSIRDIFERHVYTVDWREKYAQSALCFWQALESMVNKTDICSVIQSNIRRLFPCFTHPNELQERTMLLLCNAFNGFLNNLGGSFDNNTHQEKVVVVCEREYGPFANGSFPVSATHDSGNFADSVLFATTIVRGNRAEGRVQGLPSQPVVVILQEVVREIDGPDWENLAPVSLEELCQLSGWHSMSDSAFLAHAKILQHRLPLPVACALNEVRKKVAALYDPQKEITEHIIGGHIVPVATIADASRRTRFIAPFSLTGYDE